LRSCTAVEPFIQNANATDFFDQSEISNTIWYIVDFVAEQF